MVGAKEVEVLVDKITPILAGWAPEIQGATLASLLAIWLAGFKSLEGPADAEAYRATVLARHLKAVDEMVQLELLQQWTEPH